MNERIRELAKDAELDWHKHWSDDESNRLEKFAELIVRECIDIAYQEGDNVAYLALHFGVEE